jgi:hypothetical protein
LAGNLPFLPQRRRPEGEDDDDDDDDDEGEEANSSVSRKRRRGRAKARRSAEGRGCRERPRRSSWGGIFGMGCGDGGGDGGGERSEGVRGRRMEGQGHMTRHLLRTYLCSGEAVY